MTDPENATLPVPVNQPPASPRTGLIWFAMLLLVLAICGASGVGWWLHQQHEQAVAAVLAQQQRLEADWKTQQRAVLELQQGLGQQLVQQQTQWQQLQRAQDSLSRELLGLAGSTRSDWLLAEAEYLLRIANQRLQMERDVVGAVRVLQAADQVLAELDDPLVFNVRKSLSNDILQLQAAEPLDDVGLYNQLQAAINLAASLQLHSLVAAQERSLTPDASSVNAASGVERLWQRTQDWLQQVFVYRRLDHNLQAALIAPDQAVYLQHNLRLLLQQAQLAALRHEQALYESSLQQARLWLRTYFTPEVSSVRALDTLLDSLFTIELAPTLPDISGSLRQLKGVTASLYRQGRADSLPATPAAGGVAP